MYSQPQKSYGLAASVDAVPLSLGSSTLNKPIPSSIRTNAIIASNGQQQAGGMLSFTLPTGSGTGFVKSGSMYLRCKVTPTGMAGAGARWCFNGPLHSAANIIRTQSIFVSGQLVDQIQNMGLTHEMLLAHTTNKNFVDGDCAITQTSNVVANSFTAATSKEVIIPIISSLFNSQKAFPLFLVNAPILMQLDLETVSNAIFSIAGGGTAATGYTVDNAMLVYDHISVDESYKMAVKQAMAEGRLYQLNLTQFLNSKVSKGAANQLTYNIGINCSSCEGILWAISQDPADATTERLLLSRDINATCDFNVKLDGVQFENQQLNSESVIYAEMNKVFANLLDPAQSFVGVSTKNIADGTNPTVTFTDVTTTSENYRTRLFTGGVNTRRFAENLSMTGSPVQNLQFSLTTASNNASDLVYYWVLYSTILTIDATGSVVLVR